VLQHLRDEHPQTIALVLAHLPARLGATLLAGLDPDMQASVATRLATLERADPDVVSRSRRRCGPASARSVAQRPPRRRQGARDLLNQADRTTERSILGQLEATDPELAERVRALMFVFEDLVTLDDRSLQEVLRQIDPQRWRSPSRASRRAAETIERNLSERARTTLAEEMDLLGQVRLKRRRGRPVRGRPAPSTSSRRRAASQLARGQEEFVA
jgi:flagellar motor switch protein FliG